MIAILSKNTPPFYHTFKQWRVQVKHPEITNNCFANRKLTFHLSITFLKANIKEVDGPGLSKPLQRNGAQRRNRRKRTNISYSNYWKRAPNIINNGRSHQSTWISFWNLNISVRKTSTDEPLFKNNKSAFYVDDLETFKPKWFWYIVLPIVL